MTDGPYKVRVIHREIITVEDVAHADTKLRIPMKKNSHSDLCFSNVFFFFCSSIQVKEENRYRIVQTWLHQESQTLDAVNA